MSQLPASHKSFKFCGKEKSSKREPSVRVTDERRGVFPPLFVFNHKTRESSTKIYGKDGFELRIFTLLDNMGTVFIAFHDHEARKVAFYAHDENEKLDNENESTYHLMKIFSDVGDLFIGNSSAEALPEFMCGNSLLFQLGDSLNYVYYEMGVKSFTALAKITEYVSPVGNSGVIWPVAVDKKGNLYNLVGEKVALGGLSRHSNYIDQEGYLVMEAWAGKSEEIAPLKVKVLVERFPFYKEAKSVKRKKRS